MRAPLTLLAGCALPLIAVAPAAAGARYRATLTFSGSYDRIELDAGATVLHVSSAASWSVVAGRVRVVTQGASTAMFADPHTRARITTTQAGTATSCTPADQPFRDHVATQPARSWFALAHRGRAVDLTFGWSALAIDRVLAPVVDAACNDPGSTDSGAGDDDVAGGPAQADRLGVHLALPLARIRAGRAVTVRVRVDRTIDDVVGGTGARERLVGTYTLRLRRVA